MIEFVTLPIFLTLGAKLARESIAETFERETSETSAYLAHVLNEKYIAGFRAGAEETLRQIEARVDEEERKAEEARAKREAEPLLFVLTYALEREGLRLVGPFKDHAELREWTDNWQEEVGGDLRWHIVPIKRDSGSIRFSIEQPL